MINKIDKPLVKPSKRKREKMQINKIRDEKGASHQIQMKSSESPGNNLKFHILINWNTTKKWMNF
jgi:hypothetical protein